MTSNSNQQKLDVQRRIREHRQRQDALVEEYISATVGRSSAAAKVAKVVEGNAERLAKAEGVEAEHATKVAAALVALADDVGDDVAGSLLDIGIIDIKAARKATGKTTGRPGGRSGRTAVPAPG